MWGGVTILWWRDVIRESTYQCIHTKETSSSISLGFIIFLVSEIFFFISFFWAYFHRILSPSIELGILFPSKGIEPFEPIKIPLLNSFILLSSGITVTLAHHYLLKNDYKRSSLYLFLTIILGLVFTLFQLLEYELSTFTITDSVYGSLFFFMTGFHGLHVLVGRVFLRVSLYRVIKGHYISYHHLGFEIAVWYWHFVDVIWLFLYICLYWWCIL